jgi:hypothetical protein
MLILSKVFDMRSKEIKAKTTKAVRGHKVSVGAVVIAVIFFVLGMAAMNAGFDNLGPILLLLGGLIVFLGVLPLFDISGWAMALLVLGAIAGVVLFTVPLVENMFLELDAFINELPNRFLEWFLPDWG